MDLSLKPSKKNLMLKQNHYLEGNQGKTSAKEKRPSGEVKTKNLNSMTLSELKKRPSKEISGISSMKKSDLIAVIKK